jgi:hypothetical protein
LGRFYPMASSAKLQAQHLRRLEGLLKLTGVQSAQLADNELSNVDGLAELHLLSSLNLSVCSLQEHALSCHLESGICRSVETAVHGW